MRRPELRDLIDSAISGGLGYVVGGNYGPWMTHWPAAAPAAWLGFTGRIPLLRYGPAR